MEYSRVLSLVFCICVCCCFFSTAQARSHKHSKHKHAHASPVSQISLPPCPPPEPANQTNGGHSYNSTNVFDVRSFGAVGNGIADDTQAFKAAWDTACQVEESAIVFVPYGYSFMIQSTIFTGPCQSRLVFQVMWLVQACWYILYSFKRWKRLMGFRRTGWWYAYATRWTRLLATE